MPLSEKKIQSTFSEISSLVILCIVFGIAVAYWYLLQSIFSTTCFALLWSFLLVTPRDHMERFFVASDQKARSLLVDRIFGQGWYILKLSMFIFAITLSISAAIFSPLVALLVGAIAGYLVLMVVLCDRKVLASILVILFSVILIVFVCSVLIGRFYYEGYVVTNKIIVYLQENQEIAHLIHDYERSHVFQFVRNLAAQYGYEKELLKYMDLNNIKDWVLQNLQIFYDNYEVLFGGAKHLAQTVIFGGVFQFVEGTSVTISNFLLFWSQLYYFLQYNSAVMECLHVLSPYPRKETSVLFSRVKRSILTIFGCFAVMGISCGLVTLISFYVCGFEFLFVFSFLSGLMSTLPLLSSKVVWVPACLFLYVKEEISLIFFVTGFHTFSEWIIAPLIYSMVPDSHPYVTSLSIVLGIYTFGLQGAFFGPLIVTFSVQLFDLYRIQVSENPEKEAAKRAKKAAKKKAREQRDGIQGVSNSSTPITPSAEFGGEVTAASVAVAAIGNIVGRVRSASMKLAAMASPPQSPMYHMPKHDSFISVDSSVDGAEVDEENDQEQTLTKTVKSPTTILRTRPGRSSMKVPTDRFLTLSDEAHSEDSGTIPRSVASKSRRMSVRINQSAIQ